MKKAAIYLLAILNVSAMLSCNNSSGGNAETTDSSAIKAAEWKIGVGLYSFNQHSFSTALAQTDSVGVKYVEGFSFYDKMGHEFKDSAMGHVDKDGVMLMKKMLAEKGLIMKSMYVSDAKTVDEWKRYFDLGAALGLEYLVCEPAKDQWDLVDSLAGLFNIKIAIHEHAKGLSEYWHPDSVLAAIKGHKNIGACADLGHWARSGLNDVECLKKLEGHIIGIHLKDVDSLGNRNANDVTVGKGVIDYPAVVKELKRQKFNGFIEVECEHGASNNGADIKEGIKYINELAAKN